MRALSQRSFAHKNTFVLSMYQIWVPSATFITLLNNNVRYWSDP